MPLRATLFATLASVACAASGAALTADEIIAHNVAARGGAAQLAALATLRLTGHVVIPGANLDLGIVQLSRRPDAIRQELTYQGLTQVQAWDGHEGWEVRPFQGRKDPARMSADDAKSLQLDADFETPLFNYRPKGHSVEYLGTEDVDGTPAYKLRVKLRWGDEITYWIDPDTWMIIRGLQRQFQRGAEQVTEVDYGEYERVGGVYLPMTEEFGPKDSDSTQKQKIVFESAAANVSIDPAVFAFPAAKR
jgi:outer membrane lipoprotein-sorting protein